LAKEFFSLLLLQFVEVGILSRCGNDGRFVWFTEMAVIENEEAIAVHYILGVVIGIAVHNSILLNFPIPPCIYKLMVDAKVIFTHMHITFY